LHVYLEVATPKATKRIGLRFINRIEIPSQTIEIEDYILTLPMVPKPVPQIFSKWVQRVEIPFEENNGVMILQSGSINTNDQTVTAIILDMNFTTLDVGKTSIESSMDWVEDAHTQIEKTFEACITEKTRSLFNKETKDG
jgi:uncharacterized protein (TIGR04255 family)